MLATKFNYLICAFAAAIMLGGCGLGTKSQRKEAIRKEIGPITFEVRQLSSAQLAEMYGSQQGPSQRDSAISQYDNFFCLRMDVLLDGETKSLLEYNGTTEELDSDMVESYYLFQMQNEISLYDDEGNTYPCLVYYYERPNDVISVNRFLIGFKRPKGNALTLKIGPRYLGCGPLNIAI